jgi:frataxin-like iron-binding protein CyaY
MKQIEEIKGKFEEKNEKTFLSIIFDIDSFRNKQLVINEENNEILTDSNEDKDDILMNYQKCLQSIFI